MTDVVLERRFDSPTTIDEVVEDAKAQAGCFALYQVEWQRSFMSNDRRRLVCWFRGTDVESVRTALRKNDVDTRVVWGGSFHEAPGLGRGDLDTVNVAVERRFDEPTTLDAIQAIEDAGARCLEMRDVEFVFTLFSGDRRRMLCFYRAPDAESVRQAQHEAGMPVEAVWGLDIINMALVESST